MRRTTINLTEATDRQIEYLKECGYGSFTQIVRLAVDRMYRKEMEMERIAKKEPQDGLAKSYEELVEMATQAYWVRPINADNPSFSRYWHVVDRSQDGLVHYARR